MSLLSEMQTKNQIGIAFIANNLFTANKYKNVLLRT